MRGKMFALIFVLALGTLFAANAHSQEQADATAPATAPQPAQPPRAPRKAPAAVPVSELVPSKSKAAAPAAGDARQQGQNLADDPQYKADVIHLLEVMHVREDMMQGAGDGFDDMLAQLQDLLPDLPDKDKILEAYKKALVGLFQSQDLTDRIVAVYAQYLSDEDVKGITQFFESPSGKHYQATQSDMGNSLADAVGQLGKDKVPSILGGLCTEFPDLQGKVAFCSAGQENKSVMLDSRAQSRRGL
jgi:hypothetical protein